MKHKTSSRHDRHDLLARPPCRAHDDELGNETSIVDPVAQLRELAELRGRGLLSEEQYETQMAKVLGA